MVMFISNIGKHVVMFYVSYVRQIFIKLSTKFNSPKLEVLGDFISSFRKNQETFYFLQLLVSFALVEYAVAHAIGISYTGFKTFNFKRKRKEEEVSECARYASVLDKRFPRQ